MCLWTQSTARPAALTASSEERGVSRYSPSSTKETSKSVGAANPDENVPLAGVTWRSRDRPCWINSLSVAFSGLTKEILKIASANELPGLDPRRDLATSWFSCLAVPK
eukprot:7469474-Pyramimonas_sp.AAC.1